MAEATKSEFNNIPWVGKSQRKEENKNVFIIITVGVETQNRRWIENENDSWWRADGERELSTRKREEKEKSEENEEVGRREALDELKSIFSLSRRA